LFIGPNTGLAVVITGEVGLFMGFCITGEEALALVAPVFCTAIRGFVPLKVVFTGEAALFMVVVLDVLGLGSWMSLNGDTDLDRELVLP